MVYVYYKNNNSYCPLYNRKLITTQCGVTVYKRKNNSVGIVLNYINSIYNNNILIYIAKTTYDINYYISMRVSVYVGVCWCQEECMCMCVCVCM